MMPFAQKSNALPYGVGYCWDNSPFTFNTATFHAPAAELLGKEKNMNEPLFINYYMRDEEAAKELTKHTFDTAQKPLIILMVLFSLFLAFVTVSSGEDLFSTYAWLVCAAVTAVLAISFIKSSKTQHKIFLQRDIENYGEMPSIQSTVYDEYIEMFDRVATRRYELSHIVSAFETKNYIVLMTKGNQAFMFKKDGFVLGTADGFLDFLKSKNITIRK